MMLTFYVIYEAYNSEDRMKGNFLEKRKFGNVEKLEESVVCFWHIFFSFTSLK